MERYSFMTQGIILMAHMLNVQWLPGPDLVATKINNVLLSTLAVTHNINTLFQHSAGTLMIQGFSSAVQQMKL